MCKHDVRRLDVAVYYLLGVHILHSIKQLSSYLMYHLFSHLAAFHSRLKRLAVHIFHDDTLAKVAHWLHAYSAADVGMIELQSYLKLLHQRLTIHWRITKIRLQAFQHIALAISHGCEHTRMARLRHIALADIGESVVGSCYVKIRFAIYVYHISRSRAVFTVIHNLSKLSFSLSKVRHCVLPQRVVYVRHYALYTAGTAAVP